MAWGIHHTHMTHTPKVHVPLLSYAHDRQTLPRRPLRLRSNTTTTSRTAAIAWVWQWVMAKTNTGQVKVGFPPKERPQSAQYCRRYW